LIALYPDGSEQLIKPVHIGNGAESHE
jgi:hypothetical protein